jgi:TATA-box binding protein (TBP) (component of TFIID and TFIIIB)
MNSFNGKKAKILEKDVCSDLDLYPMDVMQKKITSNGKDGVYVSTMTIDCKLPVTFYPATIRKYARVTSERIVFVKRIKQKKENKKVIKANTIVRKSKSQKKTSSFLNQTTIGVRVSHKPADKPISIKIFKDGALHFTGCVNAMSVIEAVHVLCEEFKHPRFVRCGNKMKQINFVKNTENLDITKLYDFSINMVNVNFKIPMAIDRTSLYKLLKKDNHIVSYDSNSHAAVNLKYILKNKESEFKGVKIRKKNDLGKNEKRVTLLIFESGHIIIIMSNQGLRALDEVYNFIEEFIMKNYEDIVMDAHLVDDCIEEYINNIDIDEIYEQILEKGNDLWFDSTQPTILPKKTDVGFVQTVLV